MPFTLSHTAAVLPLLRSRKLSATGLIIGTMVPDFEYFFRIDIYSVYGHTLPGLFYFDIPVSILLAFLFHSIARNNFIDNLPHFLQVRFVELRHLNFTNTFRHRPVAFMVSALIGSLTHITWDGFTHLRGWFVQHMPWLYEGAYVPFQGAKYPLWYALQHVSTGIGLFVGALYILFVMKPTGRAHAKPRLVYWFLLMAIMIATASIKWYVGIRSMPSVTTVIALVSGFCIGIILLGFVRFRNEIPLGPAD
jgi:hypothetical protein